MRRRATLRNVPRPRPQRPHPPRPPPRAAPAPATPAAPLECSPEQQRDLGGLLDLLHCPVRRSILFALAAAPGTVTFSAPGGDPLDRTSPSGKGPPRVSSGQGPPQVCLNVTALAKCTAIAQNTLSQHLALLRTAGLVYSQRRGKSIFYEAAEDRVVFRRDANENGGFSLTVIARGSGVSVTIAVSAKNAEAETRPQRRGGAETDAEKNSFDHESTRIFTNDGEEGSATDGAPGSP
jgi:DNA-binding transcriptional ArsR family regulator